MSATTPVQKIDLQIQPIATSTAWSAALLPVPEFPAPSGRFDPVRRFLDAFAAILTQQKSLEQELFYQTWKLSSANGGDLISDNLEAWALDVGLGVWPDREPPTGWTETRMVDAAAAYFRGDEPDVPMRRVLHNKVSRSARQTAATQMRGFGVQIETFSARAFEEIADAAREAFLPTIVQRRFRSEDYYLPLLDSASVQRGDANQCLDKWMCGIEVYVRESAEDKGVLILSKTPLDELLPKVEQELLLLAESA